jgi:hypothetical protein
MDTKSRFGNVQLANLTTKTKENLIAIADGMLKMKLNSQKIDVFWMKRKECPELAREALKLLVPLAIFYQCESTFSSNQKLKEK